MKREQRVSRVGRKTWCRIDTCEIRRGGRRTGWSLELQSSSKNIVACRWGAPEQRLSTERNPMVKRKPIQKNPVVSWKQPRESLANAEVNYGT